MLQDENVLIFVDPDRSQLSFVNRMNVAEAPSSTTFTAASSDSCFRASNRDQGGARQTLRKQGFGGLGWSMASCFASGLTWFRTGKFLDAK
ncbi:uncharacterized protein UDID_19629 [Ustilago sp. UG-2017a]|nr:uncharacterized protein UDID_19629 [Ustilago sp. UG-2017a]